MVQEYDFMGTVNIGFEGDCLGKIKTAELKKKLVAEIESFLESQDNISEYSVYESDIDMDYEEME